MNRNINLFISDEVESDSICAFIGRVTYNLKRKKQREYLRYSYVDSLSPVAAPG